MPRPRSDLSPRILEVARRRFLLEGVDGASLRSIAADAGTTIGMIYYYFPTKDDLFHAVVTRTYEGMLADAVTALRSEKPPEERIAALYARVAAMNDEEFDIVRLILREAMISSSRLQRLAQMAVEGHLPWLVSTLAEGRGAGKFDASLPLPVETATTMVLALMPQIMLRLVQRAALEVPYPMPTAEQLGVLMPRVLLDGIGAKKVDR